jgi:hypothetical protein
MSNDKYFECKVEQWALHLVRRGPHRAAKVGRNGERALSAFVFNSDRAQTLSPARAHERRKRRGRPHRILPFGSQRLARESCNTF